MKKNTNYLALKADLINQLINEGYHNLSIATQISMIEAWMDNANDEDSPLNYLGAEMFVKFLNFILIHNLDCRIGNQQPFVPSQDYGQEVARVLQHYMQSSDDVNGETDTFASKNTPNNFSDSTDEEWVSAPKASSTVQHFTDVLVKSILDDETYSNFAKYKELYEVDGTINKWVQARNCRPFCPTQNYAQELHRQNRAPELIELIKQDSSFIDLWYTIDVAGQDMFFRSMPDAPSVDAKKNQITKLW